MTQGKSTGDSGELKTPYQKLVASSYYGLLGVQPSASAQQIRQAYRDLSKLYHPDTTDLPAAIATGKFQELNEAYATLSNPESRTIYDRKIGYSRVAVVQPLPSLNQPLTQPRSQWSSAYLDPTDRPLSPGEMFALFILGLTFIACLLLAIAIGITRGETAFQPVATQSNSVYQVTSSPQTESPAIAPAKPSMPSTSPAAGASAQPIYPLTSFERSHGTPSS